MYSYICIHSTHMHVTANTCYLQICLCCYSVAKSCLILCDPMNCSMPGFQGLHSLRIYTDSCLLSQGCYLSFSSSAAPFSCPQSFPTSRSCLLAKCIYNPKINTHRTSQVKQDNALLSCFCSHAVNKCPCCTLFKCMVFLIFVTFVGDFALSPHREGEKGMEIHFTVLVWGITQMEKPGGLHSMQLQGVNHD